MLIKAKERVLRSDTISNSFSLRANKCQRDVAQQILALVSEHERDPYAFMAAYRRTIPLATRKLFGYAENNFFRPLKQTAHDITTRASAVLIASNSVNFSYTRANLT